MQAKKTVFIIVSVFIIAALSFWVFTGNTPKASLAEDGAGDGASAVTEKAADAAGTVSGNNSGAAGRVVLNIIGKTGNGRDFFENARLSFMEKNKNIEINYIGKATQDAVDYLLEHDDMDGWLAADETAAGILQDGYAKSHGGQKLKMEVTPIVTSPLVVLGWEERMSRLKTVNTDTVYELVSKGKSWGEISGDTSWGFFNFSHTDAEKSNSGIQFLMLLVQNYYAKQGIVKKELTVGDVADPKVMDYVKAFEKNTSKQVEGSGKFIETMTLYGPSQYDAGVIYEYYALSNTATAQGRWGKLHIYYPDPTIWSSKPLIVFKDKNSTPEKEAALKAFKEYLLSAEVRKQALEEGYRPAGAAPEDLAVLESKFSSYGFRKDTGSSLATPTQAVIENIRNLAQRARQ